MKQDNNSNHISDTKDNSPDDDNFQIRDLGMEREEDSNNKFTENLGRIFNSIGNTDSNDCLITIIGTIAISTRTIQGQFNTDEVLNFYYSIINAFQLAAQDIFDNSEDEFGDSEDFDDSIAPQQSKPAYEVIFGNSEDEFGDSEDFDDSIAPQQIQLAAQDIFGDSEDMSWLYN
ncbi:MAG: hypothetical protein U1E31_01255 [Rickettsiales bacterium]